MRVHGLRRALAALPPAFGAVVMGTGVVSIALARDGQETPSRALLAVAAVCWTVVAAAVLERALFEPARLRREACSPAALTTVAGTAVIGSRVALLGWTGVATVLLVVALVLAAALIGPVLRGISPPTVGVSLVLAVATESLAVLSAGVARDEHIGWLAVAALAPFALGLVFYAFVIARFDFGQLSVGRGDQWIAGGALAISALAIGSITLASRATGVLRGVRPELEAVAIALWAITMVWLPLLVAFELRRPRLRYDLERWSTVFPLGMYATCSFVVGRVVHAGAITDFARIWTWVAVAAWLVVFGAMLWRVALRAATAPGLKS